MFAWIDFTHSISSIYLSVCVDSTHCILVSYSNSHLWFAEFINSFRFQSEFDKTLKKLYEQKKMTDYHSFEFSLFFAITNFISSDSTLCCFVSVFMKFVLVFIIDSYIRFDRTLTGCYALLSYVEFRLKCDNRAANMRITSDKWCVKWL